MMKKLGMVIASIAGIAGLAGLGSALLNYLMPGGANPLQMAFKTQSISYDCSRSRTMTKNDCEVIVDLQKTLNINGGYGFSDEHPLGRFGNESAYRLEGDDPCSRGGITCNNAGRITEIRLFRYAFEGTISERIGELSELIVFDIENGGGGDVGAYGCIPSSITNLTKLKHINAGYNRLSCGLEHIMKMTSLEVVELRANNLYGEIPIGLGNLKTLKWFQINNNNLCGKLPNDIIKTTIENYDNKNLSYNFILANQEDYDSNFWEQLGKANFLTNDKSKIIWEQSASICKDGKYHMCGEKYLDVNKSFYGKTKQGCENMFSVPNKIDGLCLSPYKGRHYDPQNQSIPMYLRYNSSTQRRFWVCNPYAEKNFDNNKASCTTECSYCGDSVADVKHGEQCDDGINNGTPLSKCTTSCKKKLTVNVIDSEEADNEYTDGLVGGTDGGFIGGGGK